MKPFPRGRSWHCCDVIRWRRNLGHVTLIDLCCPVSMINEWSVCLIGCHWCNEWGIRFFCRRFLVTSFGIRHHSWNAAISFVQKKRTVLHEYKASLDQIQRCDSDSCLYRRQRVCIAAGTSHTRPREPIWTISTQVNNKTHTSAAELQKVRAKRRMESEHWQTPCQLSCAGYLSLSEPVTQRKRFPSGTHQRTRIEVTLKGNIFPKTGEFKKWKFSFFLLKIIVYQLMSFCKKSVTLQVTPIMSKLVDNACLWWKKNWISFI